MNKDILKKAAASVGLIGMLSFMAFVAGNAGYQRGFNMGNESGYQAGSIDAIRGTGDIGMWYNFASLRPAQSSRPTNAHRVAFIGIYATKSACAKLASENRQRWGWGPSAIPFAPLNGPGFCVPLPAQFTTS
jgi:hypothetical protein